MPRFPVRHRLAVRGAVLTALALCAVPQLVAARDAPAPVIEAATQPGITQAKAREMEDRIQRLERQLESQALVELLNTVERLQQEMQMLSGQIEEMNHSLEELRKRQRDLYVDVDQRLRALEEGRAATAAPAPLNAAPAPAPAREAQTDAQLERKNYEMAFNLLSEGKYDQAVAAFQAFLATYASGSYADNAQYWLGEANYVQRRYNEALTEFDKVVKNYPDSEKRADAMLKMGYTYHELGDIEKARVLLNDIIRNYPDSSAARLAAKRLQDFKRIQ